MLKCLKRIFLTACAAMLISAYIQGGVPNVIVMSMVIVMLIAPYYLVKYIWGIAGSRAKIERNHYEENLKRQKTSRT